ncbi:hypothetical protein [Shinella sp.]|uniref:hypothetical protein n=1 Tax=Shinella sp. TaxID=1870904 RepID=UPI0028A9BA59|nr:hypothetical protein [Shinella sp.]
MNIQDIGDFISRTRYKIALRIRLLIDLAMLIAGVALANFGGTSFTDYAGSGLAGISIYLFITNIFSEMRKNDQTRVVENEEYSKHLLDCVLPSGFQMHLGALGHEQFRANSSTVAARPYISSDEVNELLDSSRNPVHLDMEKFEVPQALEDFRARCVNLKKPNRNDPKIRLETDVTPTALTRRDPFRLRRTDYFSGSATNEMACDQFETVSKVRLGRPALLFSVGDLVIHNGRLLGLQESVLSNHIGVSTIVITSDHQFVLQDQGDQAVSANETAVGASGSLDLRDFEETRLNASTLQGLLRYGMEREAKEELSAEFTNGRSNTVLTGYARYLARGGKPEFFGITRTRSTLSQLKPTRPDKRFVANIRGIPFSPSNEGLLDVIASLLDDGENNRRRYSLSMVVTLRMGRDYLKRNQLQF